MSHEQVDILVIGAGPAGLMAAATAAAAGRRVRVCERMESPGRKLLTTGGGRCNLTTAASADAILVAFGRQGRFLQGALREFPPAAIREFFAAAGVPTMAQEDGCVFPVSQRARDVLDALLCAADRYGARIACRCDVRKIVRCNGVVTGVETADGFLDAPRVILAAGGKSYPALGSDGSGFALAVEAGHTLMAPVPALAPLMTAETWPARLAGVVLEAARVRIDRKGASREGRLGPVLFTHRGVSGPPVLNISGEVAALLAAGEKVRLLVAPRVDRDATIWRARFDAWRAPFGRRALHNLLAGELPRGLAQVLCEQADLATGATLAQARREQLETLARLCAELPLTIVRIEGWDHAMVTRGGVALREVAPHTLQSRLVSGLFFAGEVLDLNGPCGGYNLTWAFASGRLAGRSAGESMP